MHSHCISISGNCKMCPSLPDSLHPSCVRLQRLATLLAQGQKQGLGDKVLLSGLHTQPALSTTATLSTPLQRAETPIAAAAYTRVRVEHGSNSLLRTLGVATARRSANPAVPIKMAGEEALSSPPQNSRHMEHGSNALLKLLTGHTGIPNTGAHRNTLLYHTTHPTPSSTRKAAVARGHNAAARSGTRETVQNGLKKKASSWFWPFF